MTVIEFYDKNAIENIAGAMLCRPERVVLVGDNENKMAKSCRIYQNILQNNGINTELYYSVIDKTSLSNIVECLEEIVAQIDDIVFDLTGGDELYLVAVGIIMERYGERIQSHRFNFANDTLNDCDADGKVISVKTFDISAVDNIAIYGGELVVNKEAANHTYDWQLDDEFADDVEKMWSICKQNPGNWNAQIGIIGKICDEYSNQDSLTVSYNPLRVNQELGEGKRWYWVKEWLLNDLQSLGLIHSLNIGEKISFKFKNKKVKRCLTIAGQVLELFIAFRLRSILDGDKKPLYNDVRVGTVINWDDEDSKRGVNIINEIDVMAMKGVIPVFISCKNGILEVDELYKLNTVADRFGGKYAKRVLVTSNLLDSNTNVAHLNARMKEMGIIHIDNVYRASDYDLSMTLSSLWKDK